MPSTGAACSALYLTDYGRYRRDYFFYVFVHVTTPDSMTREGSHTRDLVRAIDRRPDRRPDVEISQPRPGVGVIDRSRPVDG